MSSDFKPIPTASNSHKGVLKRKAMKTHTEKISSSLHGFDFRKLVSFGLKRVGIFLAPFGSSALH
jgi:hypothetical protein